MTLQEQYQLAAQNNTVLLSRIVFYICSTFNINKETYMSNIKYYTKKILYEIKNNNNKAVELRLERKKVREDLEDLERAYCREPSMDFVGRGRDTGGHANGEELRQIEKAVLREKLGELLVESQLLEKSLESNNELIKSLINIIPRTQYIQVLEMTYIHCMSNTEIAIELNYSRDFVDKARIRGLTDITKILKEIIK